MNGTTAAVGAGKSVLLYSGWQTINIGDIGHTPGTLRYLTEHLTGARVTLWLANTNDAVSAMLRRRFPQVEHVRGGLSPEGVATTPELQAAFDAADLVIQNSGMHYNRFWKPWPGLLQACAAKNKPLGLWAQSFDGLAPEHEEQFRGLFSGAAFVFTRECDSLAYLRDEMNATPPVLEFGPDGCFGSDVRDDAAADAFLAANGLEPGGFVSVTIRTNTPKFGATSGDPLNPLTPTPEQQEQDERWAAALREVILAWVEDTGKRVLLAPEVDKEIAPAKRLLLDRLPEHVRPHVIHRETFWNVDEAASVYARAAALVSMEPHSPILALGQGTPSIHLYSRRHGIKAAMFRDIGLSEWLLEIDRPASAARCASELLSIAAAPERARAKVARAMAFVHARSAEMAADALRAME